MILVPPTHYDGFYLAAAFTAAIRRTSIAAVREAAKLKSQSSILIEPTGSTKDSCCATEPSFNLADTHLPFELR
jgi:hypothetical protein